MNWVLLAAWVFAGGWGRWWHTELGIRMAGYDLLERSGASAEVRRRGSQSMGRALLASWGLAALSWACGLALVARLWRASS